MSGSELLQPTDVLTVLRAIGDGQMLSLGNDALGPLMAGAGECGVDAETAGAALDPTGKGENWLRELGKEMATDANLRSLTRAILQL